MRGLLPIAAGLTAAALVFIAVLALTSDAREEGGERVSSTQHAGAAVFAAMGCGGCHHLSAAGSTGEIGPDLDIVLASHTAESLKAKITSPTPGTAMPEDFEKRMSATELDALVGYLLQAGR